MLASQQGLRPASARVRGQDRLLQLQRIEDCQKIVGGSLEVVTTENG